MEIGNCEQAEAAASGLRDCCVTRPLLPRSSIALPSPTALVKFCCHPQQSCCSYILWERQEGTASGLTARYLILPGCSLLTHLASSALSLHSHSSDKLMTDFPPFSSQLGHAAVASLDISLTCRIFAKGEPDILRPPPNSARVLGCR